MFLLILIFLSYIRKSFQQKKIKKEVHSLSDLAEILLPLNQQITLLKDNRITTQEEISELKNQRELYSGAILNFLDMGIRVLQERDTVFENGWFDTHPLPLSDVIFQEISLKSDQLIQQDHQRFYQHTFKYHDQYVIIATTDITDRRRIEQRLKQREKLAYIGEISASIAHEFKNSLAAIKGFVAALKRKPDHPPFVLNVAENISEEVSYFHQMLKDYLNYTREIKLREETFSLNILLTEIIEHYFENDSRIKIPSKLFDLYGDRDRIKQVLINLIKNGLEVEDMTIINIDVIDHPDEFEITVKNDGIGIEPEDLKHILEPFYTTKEQGTGLGLPICHHIITAHGGDFEMISPPNGGCCITVTLPKKR